MPRRIRPKPLGEGLNAFYWYQISVLDSVVVVVVVVKHTKKLSSLGVLLKLYIYQICPGPHQN